MLNSSIIFLGVFLVRVALNKGLLSALRMKQSETELLQTATIYRSKSLRVLDQWRAQTGFGFEDRCLRAIERFAADQIIDDLLGNQLPIDYDHVGDDIGDLRKWEADRSSAQCDSRAGHQS